MKLIQLKSVWKQLKVQTEICKTCFKDTSNFSFTNLFTSFGQCCKCFDKKHPKFIRFNCDEIKALGIYEYDEVMKAQIFQLKACYDIELAQTFIKPYAHLLKIKFYNHYVVCAPSSKDDDLRRGFNHVNEIFKVLNLPMLPLIEKIDSHKQSDQKFENRKLIKNHLTLVNKQDLQGKRILIVDDIYTTGSTMRACIELIKSLHPKSIKILVLCKVGK